MFWFECRVGEAYHLVPGEDLHRPVSHKTRQFNDVLNWTDMYSTSPIEVKKMIASQLIQAVRVFENYVIDIDLAVSERQLGLDFVTEPTRELTHEKRRDEPAL